MDTKASLLFDRLKNGWSSTTEKLAKSVQVFWLIDARVEQRSVRDITAAIAILGGEPKEAWAIALRVPLGDGKQAAMRLGSKGKAYEFQFADISANGELGAWSLPTPAVKGSHASIMLEQMGIACERAKI